MTRDLHSRAETVRRFNRFYTRQIGVLREGLLESPFSLTEARIIYEIAYRGKTTATELAAALRLDHGYLSRLLQRFERKGLVSKTPSEADARRKLLRLTAEGKNAFSTLNERSRQEITAMLETLSEEDQHRLVGAMQSVEHLLSEEDAAGDVYLLRTHRPGDMGWVVHRHGALYYEEYGWDETFEALVAEIVAHFIRTFDPKRERCWIAERGGEIVGSVFLAEQTDRSETTAQLRLLLVEPSARGLGIGSRLVSECTRFARQVGYEKIMLWTNSALGAARRLYEREGYRLVEEEPHRSFGHDLVGQTWELEL